MQRLEVSGAVRLIYGSLGVKGLIKINYNLRLDGVLLRYFPRDNEIPAVSR